MRPTVITAGEGNVEVFNGGVYVDEQLSLWDKLYLGGGFRVDAGSSFGDNIDYRALSEGHRVVHPLRRHRPSASWTS